MKKFVSERANELIICLATFLLCLCFFDFAVDDYSFFTCNLAARQFSDYAYFDYYYQAAIWLREYVKLLYYLMPRINWHFVVSLVHEFLCLYLLMRALRKIILKDVTSIYLVRTIQICFALLFIENIVFISHTRVSLMFCSLAAFNLAFRPGIKTKDIVTYSLIFIYGLLVRPESSMGALILTATGLFLYSFNLKELFKRLWLPALAVLVFLIIFTIDVNHTNVYVNKIEPEIEYKIEADRMVSLSSMKTAKDSVKYIMAKNGMWFDMHEFSPGYLRSLLIPGSDLSAAHALEVFRHVIKFYTWYTFMSCLIIVLLLLSLFIFPLRNFVTLKLAAFVIFTFAVLYALDYNGFLLYNRHFFNLQLTSVLILCFYFSNSFTNQNKKVKKRLLIPVLIILPFALGATVVRCKQENSIMMQQTDAMINAMARFERMYINRVVVITNDGRFLFDKHFTLLNHNYTKNTYIMFDWFTFGLTPNYVNYLSRICNCDDNDPVAFFHWLASENAVFIAAPSRFRLIENYMHIVYHCNVKFESEVRIKNFAQIPDNVEKAEIGVVSIVPDSIVQKQ